MNMEIVDKAGIVRSESTGSLNIIPGGINWTLRCQRSRTASLSLERFASLCWPAGVSGIYSGVNMKQPKTNDLKSFFKALNKSRINSISGTKSAEKQNIMQSPSLPVFRLHHQERKVDAGR